MAFLQRVFPGLYCCGVEELVDKATGKLRAGVHAELRSGSVSHCLLCTTSSSSSLSWWPRGHIGSIEFDTASVVDDGDDNNDDAVCFGQKLDRSVHCPSLSRCVTLTGRLSGRDEASGNQYAWMSITDLEAGTGVVLVDDTEHGTGVASAVAVAYVSRCLSLDLTDSVDIVRGGVKRARPPREIIDLLKRWYAGPSAVEDSAAASSTSEKPAPVTDKATTTNNPPNAILAPDVTASVSIEGSAEPSVSVPVVVDDALNQALVLWRDACLTLSADNFDHLLAVLSSHGVRCSSSLHDLERQQKQMAEEQSSQIATTTATIVATADESAMSASSVPGSESVSGETKIVYCCKSCRVQLFTEDDVIPHEAGTGQTAFGWHKRGQMTFGTEDPVQCTSLFVESQAWMEDPSNPNSTSHGNSGKLHCPNAPRCDARIGSFKWSGNQCSCGHWMTPALQVLHSRVDEKHVPR